MYLEGVPGGPRQEVALGDEVVQVVVVDHVVKVDDLVVFGEDVVATDRCPDVLTGIIFYCTSIEYHVPIL